MLNFKGLTSFLRNAVVVAFIAGASLIASAQVNIVGTVTDSASGRPIAGAYIQFIDFGSCWTSSAGSDSVGRFATRVNNYCHVVATDSGYSPWFGEVSSYFGDTLNADTLTIILARGGAIIGQVIDSTTHLPIPYATIATVAYPFDSLPPQNPYRGATADSNGRYVVSVAPGMYAVYANAYNYGMRWGPASTTQNGADVLDVKLDSTVREDVYLPNADSRSAELDCRLRNAWHTARAIVFYTQRRIRKLYVVD